MLRIALLSFAIWISLSFLVLVMVARVGMHMPRTALKSRPVRIRSLRRDLFNGL
jgi:hypothetical protein